MAASGTKIQSIRLSCGLMDFTWQNHSMLSTPHLANRRIRAPGTGILLQFQLIEQHCHWNTTGLLVYGWITMPETTLWADPSTSQALHVWIRALGWYFMALVDVLDYFPTDHPGSSKLLDWYNLTATLLDYQDESNG